jgi:Protein of unknown function (DUF5818)
MRRTSVWAMAFFALSGFGFAQEAAQPKPALPPEILGPQLIAWSYLQKPQPILQTDESQAQQQPSAQIFTGTIVKDGGKYVLRAVDGAAYQLDDQEKARQYEGKQVKISGNIDASGSLLHVTTIELIS